MQSSEPLAPIGDLNDFRLSIRLLKEHSERFRPYIIALLIILTDKVERFMRA